MGRKTLSLLLMVTTLFGQSFCCCTFAALGPVVASQTSADSCCCRSPDDSTDQCPNSSDRAGHECPCKNGKAVSANLAIDVIVPSVSHDGWACWFALVPHLGRLSLADVAPLRANYIRSTAFPRLNGVGILRAVNSLRC